MCRYVVSCLLDWSHKWSIPSELLPVCLDLIRSVTQSSCYFPFFPLFLRAIYRLHSYRLLRQLCIVWRCASVLTAAFAAPFARWLPGLDVMWWNPHFTAKCLKQSEVNWVPLSVITSSGMLCLAKFFFSLCITVSACRSCRRSISKKDEWGSVVMR